MAAPQCSHAIRFAGMCIACGVHVASSFDDCTQVMGTATSSASDTRITMAAAHAAKVSAEELSLLREQKRLVLVLDLDHTILHATADRSAAESVINSLKAEEQHRINEVDVQGTPYWVRLRPGARTFVHNMSKLFTIHVFTHGTREYAKACIRLLDGKNTCIDRLITRSDGDDVHTRKRLDYLLTPGMETVAVVLDDRCDIWDEAVVATNLWAVPQYVCFTPRDTSDSTRRTVLQKAWCDDALVHLDRVLCALHRKTVTSTTYDVRPILKSLRYMPLTGRRVAVVSHKPKRTAELAAAICSLGGTVVGVDMCVHEDVVVSGTCEAPPSREGVRLHNTKWVQHKLWEVLHTVSSRQQQNPRKRPRQQ